MSRLRRLLGAAEHAGPTDDELAVLGLVLESDDPRLKLVRDQLIRAPKIVREYPADGFRVRPTSTFDDLSFPLEVERIESDWLRLVERTSRRELEFRIVIGRHGFLKGLEGRAVDGGEWPRDWSVQIPTERSTKPPLITLPSAAEAAWFQRAAHLRLTEWLGVEIPKPIELWPPATDAAVAAREQAIGGQFPPQYRQFLTITDGMTVTGVRIYGYRDCYPIENVHLPALVVAWDADNYEDFVVVLSLDGRDETVYRIDIHDPDAGPQLLATDFAAYLRSHIGT